LQRRRLDESTRMVHALLRTLLKITVASLLVGTVLSHFGITADRLMQEAGVSPQRLAELAERGLSWALPNLSLGLLIILPMWLLAYLFRPPGARSD
jgi:acetyl-CoA acetyltransferase